MKNNSIEYLSIRSDIRFKGTLFEH